LGSDLEFGAGFYSVLGRSVFYRLPALLMAHFSNEQLPIRIVAIGITEFRWAGNPSDESLTKFVAGATQLKGLDLSINYCCYLLHFALFSQQCSIDDWDDFSNSKSLSNIETL
jgi:hypothetical protein